MTVMRVYRVRVLPEKTAQYEALERDEGVPMVTSMPGCLRAGFARVREASRPTYVFFSVWTDPQALESARASPAWGQVAQRLSELGLTEGEDVAEHWDVVRHQEGVAHLRRPL